MHELLYLKDEQIKEFIEKLYIVYRKLLSDTKPILNEYSLGLAHQKVIHILSMYDGITISDLLKKLKITKQSLNRVIKDLIKNELIFFEKSKIDTRRKHIYLSNLGKKIFEKIFSVQRERIYKAFTNSSSKEVLYFDNVIKKIINEKI
jgi:DNA-binding MarR family transcriptional regulator